MKNFGPHKITSKILWLSIQTQIPQGFLTKQIVPKVSHTVLRIYLKNFTHKLPRFKHSLLLVTDLISITVWLSKWSSGFTPPAPKNKETKIKHNSPTEKNIGQLHEDYSRKHQRYNKLEENVKLEASPPNKVTFYEFNKGAFSSQTYFVKSRISLARGSVREQRKPSTECQTRYSRFYATRGFTAPSVRFRSFPRIFQQKRNCS